MIKYKKATKYNFIWQFFLFVIVSVSIIGAVILYYSVDIEIREIENSFLIENIEDCLIKNNYLINNFQNNNFDIYLECELDKEIFEEDSIYFIKVQIFDENKNLIKEIKKGDFSFEKDCEIKNSVKMKDSVVCSNSLKKIYLDNRIKKGFIEILVASKNKGKRELK